MYIGSSSQITSREISELFPEEVSSSTEPKDVEVYIYSNVTLYVRRYFNKDGAPVPPMDAYLVAVHSDGTREDLRTSSADEITAWTKAFR